MTIVGVSRSGLFSPGRTESDSAIFSRVKESIEEQGYDVVHIPEHLLDANILNGEIHIDALFQMARSKNALSVIDNLTDDVPIVNSVQAVRNCSRIEQTILLKDKTYLPESICCRVADSLPSMWDVFPCWIKRGDSHSIEKEDVVCAQSKDEAVNIICDMLKRGIDECVLQEHISGKLVKFYGIRGEGIIDFTIVSETDCDKFGRLYNTDNIDCSVNRENIEIIAEDAACALGVDVYGGDVIVTDDDKIFLIDFNDWPSFGSCCDKAARMISALILEKIK